MGEVIAENDLGRHIRYRHRISSAHWSTDKKLWTLAATHTDDGETITFTANFLWMCQGYYRHAKGYTPDWPGMRDFKGEIVHPQSWPADMTLAGRNVVVIGSGATAATLIPAIANESAPRHLVAEVADVLLHRSGRSRVCRHFEATGNLRRGSTKSCAGRCSLNAEPSRIAQPANPRRPRQAFS